MQQENDQEQTVGGNGSQTNGNSQPLTTEGDTAEHEELMGGTTNLSLDQLEEQGDAQGTADENEDRINNADDLNEIRASDDLGEPDPEAALPPTDAKPIPEEGGDENGDTQTDAVDAEQ